MLTHVTQQIPCDVFEEQGRPPQKSRPRLTLAAFRALEGNVWEDAQFRAKLVLTSGWVSGNTEVSQSGGSARRRLLQDVDGDEPEDGLRQLSFAYGFPAVGLPYCCWAFACSVKRVCGMSCGCILSPVCMVLCIA
jgi:hypothetical protein